MFYSKTDKSKVELGIANIPTIVPSQDDDEFIVTAKYHHRPDKLANDVYGSPKYYFVFLSRNMDIMEDPVYDLREGLKIMVPHPKIIQKLK